MKVTPLRTGRFLWFILFIFCSAQISASHIVGGEIRYQCLGNDWYKVTLTYYRDCGGVIMPNATDVVIRNGNGTAVGTFNIPKEPSSYLSVSKPGCGVPTPNVCVETADYILDSIYLPGSLQGYDIYAQGCCRNNGVSNILNAWKVGSTFHSRIMSNIVSCNNSPYFATYPPLVLPATAPLTINAGATDPDADSLSYELCTPLDDDNTSPPFVSVPLAPGFTASYLVPSSPALSIDPVTGVISGTITNSGKYAVGICVNEYRNGALIGTIRRDYQFTVVQPWNVFAAISSNQDASCPSAADGSATVAVGGGTAPYTYSWSSGGTTASVSNLTAGNYSVIVTDNNGCKDTAVVSINAGAAFTASVASKTDAGCGSGSTGSATISVTGGQTPYTVTWPDASTGMTNTNLAAGTHAVAVSDGGGCIDTVYVTINTVASSLSASGVVTDEFCPGLASGAVDVTVSSGIAPFSFYWNDAVTTEDRSGLTAGNYWVAVSDSAGCTDTLHFTVNQGSGITATFDSIKNISCYGQADGYLSVSVQNNNGPLSYTWSNGSGGSSQNGLAAGAYWVVVTDSVGCMDSLYTNLIEPDSLEVTRQSLTHASCAGMTDGSISVAVTGGTAPYQLSWSNSATGTSISGLAAGSYTLTVTDAQNCTSAETYQITEPDPLTISPQSLAHESCSGNDGEISIGIHGGTKPYSISWSNGGNDTLVGNLSAGNYLVTVTDSAGCQDTMSFVINPANPPVLAVDTIIAVSCGLNNGAAHVSVSGGTSPYTINWSNGQSGPEASNLTAGSLSAFVTDSLGCTDTLQVAIPNAGGLSLALDSMSSPSCSGTNDGFAAITASGGKPPLSIRWSNGDSLTTTSGLPSGTAFVVVSDAKGCSDSISFLVPSVNPVILTTDSIKNVSCSGAADGKIKVSVSGGTPPYTYNWTNGATISTLNNLGSGSYGVTVTDSRGCFITDSFAITEPDSLHLILKNLVQPACDTNNGSLAIGIQGGTKPYSILWNTAQTDSSILNLGAGSYSITVIDSFGCSSSASYNLSAPAGIVLSLDTVVDASCGMANGYATVSVSGGTGSYQVSWSNGQSGITAAALSAGTFTASVTDSLGCVDSLSVTVSSSGSLSANVDSVAAPACPGDSSGYASLTVTGGTAPYSIFWSNTDTVQFTNTLNSGPQYVLVSDSRGCTDSISFSIPTPDTLKISLDSLEDVTCHGAADGKIKISVSGGAPPYTYSWTTGDTISTLNKLGVGTLGVTVTDSRACSKTSTFTIAQPDSLQISLKGRTAVSCHGGADGTLAISLKGGTRPYQLSWSHGQTDSSLSALSAGWYSVTLTDSMGCSLTDSFEVTEPGAFSITVDSVAAASCGQANGFGAISVTGGTAPYTYLWSGGSTADTAHSLSSGANLVMVTDSVGCSDSIVLNIPNAGNLSLSLDSLVNVNCFGSASGYLAVSASGGIAPYSYSWSNGDTTASINGIAGGSYTVTLTDNSGCVVSSTYQITEPNSLSISLKHLTNAGCDTATGTISIGINGGTKPYSISWSHGQTDSLLTNLAGGTHQVTVTDANGCTAVDSFSISQASGVTLVLDTAISTTCGAANGSAAVAVQGGAAPFSISWSNGQSGNSISNLSAGTYTATVIDSNGCEDSLSVQVSNAGGLTVNLDSLLGPACGGQDGYGQISSVGGVAPLTIRWSNGDSLAISNNLPSGPGFVTVSDALGCYDSIAFTVPQSDSLKVTLDTLQHVSCFGGNDGKLSIGISGGTPPYTIQWTHGDTISTLNKLGSGSYGVTVTDSRACSTTLSYILNEPDSLWISLKTISDISCTGVNDGEIAVAAGGGVAPYNFVWSSGGTDSTASNLFGGEHKLYLTDANGCTVVDSFVVNEPDTIGFTVDSILPASCGQANGYVKLSGFGGTPPYRFEWNTGERGGEQDSMIARLYTVRIIDTNGCDFSAHIDIPSAAPFSAQIDTLDAPSCFGMSDGKASVIVNGGTAPYTYRWLGGSTSASAHNLGSGTAFVVVQDARGCSDSLSFSVPVKDSLVISLDSLSDPRCFGGADGFIGISVSGGNTPYSYSWSNADTTALPSGLTQGTYSVVVTDSKGCSASTSFNLSDPSQLNLSLANQKDVSCNGGTDGELSINLQGGTKPYSILWNNSSTDSNLTSLSSGSYTVVVSDANGCSVSDSFTVSEPTAIQITLDSTEVAACGHANGSAYISVSGGSGVYSVLWDNGETGFNADSLTTGAHTAVVTDTAGCVDSLQVTIGAPAPLTAIIDSLAGPLCYGGADGFARVSVSGGVPPYSFAWSYAGSQHQNSNLSSGPAHVVVSDAKGCTDSVYFLVPQTDSMSIQLDSIQHVLCYGQPNAFLEVSVTGGHAPYSFSWNNNAQGKTLQNGVAGNYTVNVTDSAGCTASRTFHVTEPDSFYVIVDSVKNPSCVGGNDGAVYLRPSGNHHIAVIQANRGKVNNGNVSELGAGKYSFWVENSNGCGTLVEFEVKDPKPMKIEAYANYSPSCDDENNGVIELSISGGNGGPYTYLWDDGSLQGNRHDLGAGKHSVQITDKKGCSASQDFYVAPKKMSMHFRLEEVGCFENADAHLKVEVTGAARPYRLFLDDLPISDDQKVLAGAYQLTLVDADSCTTSRQVYVEPNKGNELYFANAFTPNGDGLNDLYELKTVSADCFTNARLEIYNRWGARIYSTDRPFEQFWDGKVNGEHAKEDTYMYNFISEERQEKGYITILK